MGFKTTRLRTHYRTLRPLKYYTFNHNVYESDGEEVKHDKKKKAKKITSDEDVDLKPLAKILERLKKSIYPRTRIDEGTEDLAHEAGAAARVLEKFRSGKRSRKVLEPCRCEDGKEVTFIIKGVCLCDKTKTKNFLTKDTCDEYCRSKLEKALPPVPEKPQEETEVFEEPEPSIYEPEVVKEPPKPCARDSKKFLEKYCNDKQDPATHRSLRLVDSKEIYRKRSQSKIAKKRNSIEGMMIDGVSLDDEGELRKKSSKSVTFKEVEMEKTAEKDDEAKRTDKEEKVRPPKPFSDEQKEIKHKEYDETLATKKQSSLVILYKNEYKTVESQLGLTEEQKRILTTSETPGTSEREPPNDYQEVAKRYTMDSVHSL